MDQLRRGLARYKPQFSRIEAIKTLPATSPGFFPFTEVSGGYQNLGTLDFILLANKDQSHGRWDDNNYSSQEQAIQKVG